MKLKRESIEWAVAQLQKENDTDLFPISKEIEIIRDLKEDVIRTISDIEIGNYRWKSSRRFIIPKSEYSYRVSTQLDPIDSVFMSAIIYEYGNLIENKRDGFENKRVFSYRFKPSNDGKMYSSDDAWKLFWKQAITKSHQYEYVVYLDIADFYNQIYHHAVENQLISCGFPNQVIKSIKEHIMLLTEGVSRGVPIGPHYAHLIAEMTLIPVDESLILKGYEFCRYSDDILLFCNSEKEAQIIIYEMAKILDKQQRLMLQKQKTLVIKSKDFENKYNLMIDDNPIDEDERKIIQILNKHSSGNPYVKVDIKKLTEEELRCFSEKALTTLVQKYLEQPYSNYSRLRWFYRRLIQTGTMNAIDVSIEKFEELMPAISDVCQYFVSAVENNDSSSWKTTGGDILSLLSNDIVQSNEYFQISILSLFVRSNKLNHIDKLIKLYSNSSEGVKRKIILASYKANAVTWIRELKEEEQRMEIWTKRALIIACSILPKDERSYYLKRINDRIASDDYMTKIIVKWSNQQ